MRLNEQPPLQQTTLACKLQKDICFWSGMKPGEAVAWTDCCWICELNSKEGKLAWVIFISFRRMSDREIKRSPKNKWNTITSPAWCSTKDWQSIRVMSRDKRSELPCSCWWWKEDQIGFSSSLELASYICVLRQIWLNKCPSICPCCYSAILLVPYYQLRTKHSTWTLGSLEKT